MFSRRSNLSGDNHKIKNASRHFTSKRSDANFRQPGYHGLDGCRPMALRRHLSVTLPFRIAELSQHKLYYGINKFVKLKNLERQLDQVLQSITYIGRLKKNISFFSIQPITY